MTTTPARMLGLRRSLRPIGKAQERWQIEVLAGPKSMRQILSAPELRTAHGEGMFVYELTSDGQNFSLISRAPTVEEITAYALGQGDAVLEHWGQDEEVEADAGIEPEKVPEPKVKLKPEPKQTKDSPDWPKTIFEWLDKNAPATLGEISVGVDLGVPILKRYLNDMQADGLVFVSDDGAWDVE